MGQLSQEQINVDLFNEVQRLKSEVENQSQKIEIYEKELDRLWTERYKEYGISKDREYVLLSVKWSKDGYLVFWGTQTKDDEKRSYSGYTMDLETCEKYTYEEAVNEHHPEWKGQKFWELQKECWDGTWAVKIKDLHVFGQRKAIIWM